MAYGYNGFGNYSYPFSQNNDPWRQSMYAQNYNIYRISYDVTFTNTSAGTAILMLYKDAVALPCANAEGTVAEGSITTLHAETTICIPTCCNFNPLISARMTAPAGTIINVCANVTRIS